MEILGIVVAAAAILFGLLFVWRDVRERQARRGELLAWANEVIDALQRLFMVCIRGHRVLSVKQQEDMTRELIFETSMLVERGRLFFRTGLAKGSHKRLIRHIEAICLTFSIPSS